MVDDIYIYNWITLTVEITNRTHTMEWMTYGDFFLELSSIGCMGVM